MKIIELVIVFVMISCSAPRVEFGKIDKTESEKIKSKILGMLESGHFALDGYDSCYFYERISSIDFTGQYYNTIFKGCMIKYISEPSINFNVTIAKTVDGDIYVFGMNLYKKLIDLYNAKALNPNIELKGINVMEKFSEFNQFNELIADVSIIENMLASDVFICFNKIFSIEKDSYYYPRMENLFTQTETDHYSLGSWLDKHKVEKDDAYNPVSFLSSKDSFDLILDLDDVALCRCVYGPKQGLEIRPIAYSNLHHTFLALDNPPIQVDCRSFR